MILGDFNIHNISDSNAQSFKTDMESLGLKQLITGSTHKGGHTPDYIWVRDEDLSTLYISVEDFTSSDYMLVNFKIEATLSRIKKKTIRYRNFRKMDRKKLRVRLQHIDTSIAFDSVDEAVDSLFCNITDILDDLAPLKEKVKKSSTGGQWFNNEVRASRQICRQLERRWRKTGRTEDKDAMNKEL